MKTNHINYPNKNNEIYCKKTDSMLKLDKKGLFWRGCFNCSMFAGTYQGNGVECCYEDNSDSPVVMCYN